MHQSRSPSVEALLFDLGGVMIDIDFERIFAHWARHSALDAAQIRARFSADTAYHAYERGELDSPDYFAHLRRLLELDAGDDDIARGWNAIFVAAIDETLALVHEVRPRLPCFAFSNTNPVHQAAWSSRFPEVVSAFDAIFVSSEIGLRKPERKAFQTVAQRIGMAPSALLFFDDMGQNVDAAAALGMQAVRVRGPGDVRTALQAAALL